MKYVLLLLLTVSCVTIDVLHVVNADKMREWGKTLCVHHHGFTKVTYTPAFDELEVQCLDDVRFNISFRDYFIYRTPSRLDDE